MKIIDLRREMLSIDELLELATRETVRVRSKSGREFILEAADAFDREVAELGRSKKFMAFLQQRLEEPGRVPIEDIERRLASAPLGDEEDPSS
jgi:hypothetical protein